MRHLRWSPVFTRSWLVVRLQGNTPGQADGYATGQVIRYATVSAVAYSLILPLMALIRVLTHPAFSGHKLEALVATLCYTPLATHLVLSAARGRRQRWRILEFAAVAVIVLGMLPVIGVVWFGALCVPAGLTLIVFRAPWSFVGFLVLGFLPIPVTAAYDEGAWASHSVVITFCYGFTLAVPVWLIAAARWVEAAREALAEKAVVRERLRIDDELQDSISTAMEGLAARGADLCPLSLTNAAAKDEIAALSGSSRETLSEVRRMVRRFRQVSLAGELETAQTLLSAAGIRVELDVPADELLTDPAPEALRSALRSGVAQILRAESAASYLIRVRRNGRRIRLELLSGGTSVLTVEESLTGRDSDASENAQVLPG